MRAQQIPEIFLNSVPEKKVIWIPMARFSNSGVANCLVIMIAYRGEGKTTCSLDAFVKCPKNSDLWIVPRENNQFRVGAAEFEKFWKQLQKTLLKLLTDLENLLLNILRGVA